MQNHTQNSTQLPPETTTTKPPATGPTTPEGKSRSSQNATKHGCRSPKRFLDGEDPAEYQQLREGFLHDYAPVTQAGHSLLEELIDSNWHLLRNTRALDAQWENAGLNPTQWNPHQTKMLGLVTRYHTAAERRFHRAFTALEHLRALRLNELRSNQREFRLNEQFEFKKESFYLKYEFTVQKETNRHQEKLLKLQAPPPPPPAATKDAEPNPTQKNPAPAIPKGKKKGDRRPYLDQWLDVNVIDGVTVTTKSPPDADLLKQAVEADPPPEFVYRRINFLCPVPPEYAWTNPPQANLERGGMGNQRMTLQTWRDCLEREASHPGRHAGPTPTGNLSRESVRY